jgi:hypothetical protein
MAEGWKQGELRTNFNKGQVEDSRQKYPEISGIERDTDRMRRG